MAPPPNVLNYIQPIFEKKSLFFQFYTKSKFGIFGFGQVGFSWCSSNGRRLNRLWTHAYEMTSSSLCHVKYIHLIIQYILGLMFGSHCGSLALVYVQPCACECALAGSESDKASVLWFWSLSCYNRGNSMNHSFLAVSHLPRFLTQPCIERPEQHEYHKAHLQD